MNHLIKNSLIVLWLNPTVKWHQKSSWYKPDYVSITFSIDTTVKSKNLVIQKFKDTKDTKTAAEKEKNVPQMQSKIRRYYLIMLLGKTSWKM